MKTKELIGILKSAVSSRRLYELACIYHQYPLKLSYSSYGRGIKWLAAQYAEQDLAIEELSFPADGKTVYADRHFPLAWDVDNGWIRVTAPGYPDPVLADYAKCTYGIVPFSADSGGEQAGVIIPAGEILNGRIKGAAGQVALFDAYPSTVSITRIRECGCRAYVACADTAPVHPSLLDARRWFNDAFGEGQIDCRHKTICGFSLTPRQTLALLAYYEKNGPIPVRYLLQARTYAGTVPAVTALLRGCEKSERSFLVSAHAYEPHATNNVAGVAVCLEAATVLSGLIRTGALPRPRHSIRFFHGLENFSLYAWALEHRAQMRQAIGGLSVDSLGRREFEDKKERFVFWQQPALRPSFFHAVAGELARLTAPVFGIDYEIKNSSSNNEDLMQDELLGPPWMLLYGSLWREPRPEAAKRYFYHSSLDTPDQLAPEILAAAALYTALTAWLLADAGADEAADLASLTSKNWSLSVAAKCRDALTAGIESPENIRDHGQRLSAWQNLALTAGRAAIASTETLIPEPQRKAFTDGLELLIKQFDSYTEAQIKSTLQTMAFGAGLAPEHSFKIKLSAVEREAVRTVPERRLPGPLGLGTIPDRKRADADRIVGWPSQEYWVLMDPGTELYWLDGRRSVWDMVKAIWADRPFSHSETLAQLCEKRMRLIGLLEECGYLTVTRGATCAPVTETDIVAGLQQLGIKSGDVVMVHASLSGFGEVIGGADTVINALAEVISAEGILAMPAFTDAVTGGKGRAYDQITSPAANFIGQIPEIFRQRPGVLRSRHPTHSVTALGRRAAEFLGGQDPYDTFDPTGPWRKLLDWNGKIIFFGESMGANTYIHALEAWFLNYTDVTMARVADGIHEHEVRITHYPAGCRGGWYRKRREAEYYQRLVGQGVYHEMRIGPAAAITVDVRTFTRAMVALLCENPAILLHHEGCLDCANRRARLVDWKIPAAPHGIKIG
ncbi:MAG: AAC(3) family N-acetyltransferase [Verrucomicrobiota bacterium]